MTQDAKLIKKLGGPAKVAALLGYKKPGSHQRVHNWITRGVPPGVKIKFPHIFLTNLKINSSP